MLDDAATPLPPYLVFDTVAGCDLCNQPAEGAPTWMMFTVSRHGVDCCPNCLTPLYLVRERRTA